MRAIDMGKMTDVNYFVERLKSGTLRYERRTGRIYTVPERKGRKPQLPENKKGNSYIRICVSDGGIERSALAHVVAWTFLHGPVPEGMEVHHKDGVRYHNQKNNLDVVTHSQNVIEGIKLRKKLGRKRLYLKHVE